MHGIRPEHGSPGGRRHTLVTSSCAANARAEDAADSQERSTMTERLVSHLRYAALAVPNFEVERDFFVRHWGLTEVHAEDGLSYLAAEGSTEPFVLRLRQDDKRVDLAGFAVRDRTDVDALAAKLHAEDVQFIHEPQQLTGFSGGYGFRVFDGDGRALEFSTGYQTREARKIREREPIPAKLSHMVFNSQDLN